MRVLVLAPVGRDAELLCSILRKRALECVSARDAHHFVDLLKVGGGTALITEEVIRDSRAFRAIVSQISKEPEWSDLPVIALVSASAAPELLSPLEQELENVNLSLVERPARSETIVRAVQSGLRARRRQYQVRDFLADRLATQENLWRTQKLESIGLLAGGIAHDFNNLLTGIIGNASMLSLTLPEGSKEASFSSQILIAAERSADLTRQLLAYSGKGRFVVEPVNLSLLIKETAQLIRASLPQSVTLRFELDQAPVYVRGDKTQLQQVVMNLILNAGEAIPEGREGMVTIASHLHQLTAENPRVTASGKPLVPGRYISLAVSDDGAGMTAQTMSQVFEPFFTTKFLGRGLGLAAVGGIVEGHGGSINVASRFGEGSTFTVLLPATEAADPQLTSIPHASFVTGLGHVLVVDDESAVQGVAKTVLESLGYAVSLASNGREALDFLAKVAQPQPVNLVILDWMMPRMNGQATLKRLIDNFPGLPVIVSSGYNEDQARASFSDTRIAGFLQKPFSAKQLSTSVAQAIGALAQRVS